MRVVDANVPGAGQAGEDGGASARRREQRFIGAEPESRAARVALLCASGDEVCGRPRWASAPAVAGAMGGNARQPPSLRRSRPRFNQAVERELDAVRAVKPASRPGRAVVGRELKSRGRSLNQRGGPELHAQRGEPCAGAPGSFSVPVSATPDAGKRTRAGRAQLQRRSGTYDDDRRASTPGLSRPGGDVQDRRARRRACACRRRRWRQARRVHPGSMRAAASCSSLPRPMRNTSVPPSFASLSMSSGSPSPAVCAVTTWKPAQGPGA